MSTVDTSAEVVERWAETLEATDMDGAAATLRALLAERDAARAALETLRVDRDLWQAATVAYAARDVDQPVRGQISLVGLGA